MGKLYSLLKFFLSCDAHARARHGDPSVAAREGTRKGPTGGRSSAIEPTSFSTPLSLVTCIRCPDASQRPAMELAGRRTQNGRAPPRAKSPTTMRQTNPRISLWRCARTGSPRSDEPSKRTEWSGRAIDVLGVANLIRGLCRNQYKECSGA